MVGEDIVLRVEFIYFVMEFYDGVDSFILVVILVLELYVEIVVNDFILLVGVVKL